MENKIAWEKYPEGNKREEVFQFAENYRKFISDCKTERECVTSFVEKAEKAGFVNLEKVIAEHTALKAGDRVYANNMGKGMALFVIGKESMEKGMNILGFNSSRASFPLPATSVSSSLLCITFSSNLQIEMSSSTISTLSAMFLFLFLCDFVELS